MSNKGRNIRIRTAESESSEDEGPRIRPGSGSTQSRTTNKPLLSSSLSSATKLTTTAVPSDSLPIISGTNVARPLSSTGSKKLGPSFMDDHEEDNIDITKKRLIGKSNIPIATTTMYSSSLPLPPSSSSSSSASATTVSFVTTASSSTASSVSDYSNEGLARLRANQLYKGNTVAPASSVGMDIDEGTTTTTMRSNHGSGSDHENNNNNEEEEEISMHDDSDNNGIDMDAIQIAQAKAAREAMRRKHAFNGSAIDEGIHEPSSGLYDSEKKGISMHNGTTFASSATKSSSAKSTQLGTQRLSSDDTNEIDEWEQSLLNRGKGGKQYTLIDDDIQKEYSLRHSSTRMMTNKSVTLASTTTMGSSSVATLVKGIPLRPLPDPNAQIELLQQRLRKVSLTYQQKTTNLNHDLSRTETELEDTRNQIRTLQSKIASLAPTFDFFQTFRLWLQECVQCLQQKSPLIVTLETAIDNYFTSIEKVRTYRRTMDLYDEIQEEQNKLKEDKERSSLSSSLNTTTPSIGTMEIPLHTYSSLLHTAEQYNIISSNNNNSNKPSTTTPSSSPSIKTILHRDIHARQGARVRRRNRIKTLLTTSIEYGNQGKLSALLESPLFTIPKSSSSSSSSTSTATSALPPSPLSLSLSDDDESDDENTSTLQQITNLQRAQSLLFQEITKDYTTVDGILHRFSLWKSNALHARTYVDSFAYLALPELLSPLIHYQCCLWYPLPLSKFSNMNPDTPSLESFEFFNALLHYTDIPINASPSVTSDTLVSATVTAQDASLEEAIHSEQYLLPRIIILHIIPRLGTMITRLFDPYSLSNTRALLSIIQDILVFDLDNESVDLLRTSIITKFRNDYDNFGRILPCFIRYITVNNITVPYELASITWYYILRTLRLGYNLLQWHGIRVMVRSTPGTKHRSTESTTNSSSLLQSQYLLSYDTLQDFIGNTILGTGLLPILTWYVDHLVDDLPSTDSVSYVPYLESSYRLGGSLLALCIRVLLPLNWYNRQDTKNIEYAQALFESSDGPLTKLRNLVNTLMYRYQKLRSTVGRTSTGMNQHSAPENGQGVTEECWTILKQFIDYSK